MSSTYMFTREVQWELARNKAINVAKLREIAIYDADKE